MSDNASSNAPASFTSDDMRNLILDYVLENSELFLPQGTPDMSKKLTGLLHVLESMSTDIATRAIANRTHLKPVKAYDLLIHGDPEKAPNDLSKYHLRYRIIEQIGDQKPSRDEVLTLDQAVTAYGKDFVENHWGTLGEKSPQCMTMPGDRKLWFSVIRFPNDGLKPLQPTEQTSKKITSPGL